MCWWQPTQRAESQIGTLPLSSAHSCGTCSPQPLFDLLTLQHFSSAGKQVVNTCSPLSSTLFFRTRLETCLIRCLPMMFARWGRALLQTISRCIVNRWETLALLGVEPKFHAISAYSEGKKDKCQDIYMTHCMMWVLMPSFFVTMYPFVSYEWKNAQFVLVKVSTSPHHGSEHGWKEYLYQALGSDRSELQNATCLRLCLVQPCHLALSLKVYRTDRLA